MLYITMSDVTSALLFFLPAYFANTFACIFGGGMPLDLGKNFVDGRRILGDGVTIRGSFFGALTGVVAGLAKAWFQGDLTDYEITLAILLSVGAILGDAIGSFIKRRLGIEKGRPAPLLDQLDFVFGALLLASLITRIQMKTIIILVVLTPFGHLMINMIGYWLKLKDVPW